MAVTKATLQIENSGRSAYYEAEDLREDGDTGPSLTIEVADFEEAQEVVETLNRSRAQKRRERKPNEATPAENGKPAANEQPTKLADPPTYPPRKTGA